MNIDRALVMIDEYLLSDCTDVNWRNCLNYVRWLIVHNKELVDNLASTNETLREQIKEKQALIDSAVSGQETLQKYHHDATELAYKNGYEAGVREFAERLKNRTELIPDHILLFKGYIDIIANELIGGADDE